MATNLKIIAHHNLPYTDVKVIMKELSDRFETNVYYVFPSYINLDEYLSTIVSKGLINPFEVEGYEVEGYIIDAYTFPNAKKNLFICDEDYMYTFLLEQFGDKAAEWTPFMKNWTNDPKLNLEVLKDFSADRCYMIAQYEGESIDFGLTISIESLDILTRSLNVRWWFVYDMVMEQDYTYLTNFLEAREFIIEMTQLLGGDKAYYIADSNSHTGIGQGDEWTMTWQEIENELHSGYFAKNLVNLRLALTDAAYFVNLQANKKTTDDHPVFYDDFGDIKLEDVLLHLGK